MKKILVYGASVTAQSGITGYFENLQNQLSKNGFELTKLAIGGCHIDDAGFYRSNEALKNKPDYIFLEWNSTGLNIFNELKIADFLKRIHRENISPIFLILPQEANLKLDRDSERQVKYIANLYSIPIIDVRQNIDKEIYSKYVRDNVHTNEEGGKVYAEIITKKFYEILDAKDNYKNFSLISDKLFDDLNPKVYSINREIFNDNQISLVVKKKSNYSEIVLNHLIGPYSPVIEISDGAIIKKISLWDSYCHYEREHFTPLITNSDFQNSYLRYPLIYKITFSNDLPNYAACRRSDIDFNLQKKILIKNIFSLGVEYEFVVN